MFLVEEFVTRDVARDDAYFFNLIYKKLQRGGLRGLGEEEAWALKAAWNERARGETHCLAVLTTLRIFYTDDCAVFYDDQAGIFRMIFYSPYNPPKDPLTKLACEAMDLPYDEDLTKKREEGKEPPFYLVAMFENFSFVQKFIKDYEEMIEKQRFGENFFTDVRLLIEDEQSN